MSASAHSQVLSGRFKGIVGRERGRHPNTFPSAPVRDCSPPRSLDQSAYFGPGCQQLSDCSSWTGPRCRRINMAPLLHLVICVLPLRRRSSALTCCSRRGCGSLAAFKHKVHPEFALESQKGKSVKDCCTCEGASLRQPVCPPVCQLETFCSHEVISVPECIYPRNVHTTTTPPMSQ